MTNFSYVVDSVTDKEGNSKDKIDGKFFIKFANVGARAILCKHDNTTLRTSKVEDITFWDNGVRITTKYSIYYLELVSTVKGVQEK